MNVSITCGKCGHVTMRDVPDASIIAALERRGMAQSVAKSRHVAQNHDGANRRENAPTGAKSRIGFALGSKSLTTEKPVTQSKGFDSMGEWFELFWRNFALKRDREKARASWNRAISRRKITTENVAQICASASQYRAFCQRTGTRQKYAQGWINDARWEDEYDDAPAVGETDPSGVIGTAEHAARVEAEESAAIARVLADDNPEAALAEG